jgi:HK97 family phage major capsid protein
MDPIERMKAKRQEILNTMAKITRVAVDQKRNLSPAESERLDELDDQARELKKQIKADEACIASISELEAQAQKGLMQGTKNLWGKQMLQEMKKYPSMGGAKALIPVAGSVTVGALSSTIGTLADVAETILQMLSYEQTDKDNITYLRETVRTHAAASVENSNLKPTSTYNLEKVNADIITIAHLSEPIPRQWLDDAPMLGDYVGQTMREGLILQLEEQIFQGSGTSDEIEGLENVSGLLGQAFDTDILTTTRKAITRLENLPIRPDGWAIHPDDWETFELLENTAGNYALGAPGQIPVDRANRRLWGLPVAVTLGVSSGTAYLANWKNSLKLWEREAVKIDWSEVFTRSVTVGADDFDKTGFETNEIKFRCEGRFQLEVDRPGGIVEVALTSS